MTAIVTTYQDGVTPRAAAHVNSLGLGLAAIGISDDVLGKLATGRSLYAPVPILSNDPNAAGKVVPSATTYLVPAGVWFVITSWFHASSVSDTITPSGGALITVSSQTNTVVRACHIVLGPGDSITTGASSTVAGYLVTAPPGLTRILVLVNNFGTSYTVAASHAAILTHAGVVGAASGITNGITIDGLLATGYPNLGEASTTGFVGSLGLYLKAGQVVAANTAGGVLLSGVSGLA